MKKKEFNVTIMRRMMLQGYTPVEVAMEKWQIMKDYDFTDLPFLAWTSNTCALCHTAIHCENCPITELHGEACYTYVDQGVWTTSRYVPIYDIVHATYIYELLKKGAPRWAL